MDVDIKELIKTAAENVNLKDFKGDIVGVKYVETEIGNIEKGGIGVQNVYYGAEGKREEKCPDSIYILDSKEAKTIFRKLIKAGILDENGMPGDDLSLAQKGTLVRLICQRLNIDNSWKAFGIKWNMNPETLRKAAEDGEKQKKIGEFIDRFNDALR